MTVQRVLCNACGASLDVAASAQQVKCDYCGATWQIATSAGHATLLAGDQMRQAVQDSGTAMQIELKRLQLGQELAAARMQLTQVQAEIRELERAKPDSRRRAQLQALRQQAAALQAQITDLQHQLHPPPAQPAAPPTTVSSPGALRRFLTWRVKLGALTVSGALLTLGLCCLCSVSTLIFSPRTPTPTPTVAEAPTAGAVAVPVHSPTTTAPLPNPTRTLAFTPTRAQPSLTVTRPAAATPTARPMATVPASATPPPTATVPAATATAPRPTATAVPPAVTYKTLAGKLFVDVRVYYGRGADKTFAFTAVGGSSQCRTMPSGRGVLVRFADGHTEWKDRDYLITSGLFFVKSDDPNATSFQWIDTLPDCP